jgi:RimJ/RimL family protein N-acetyltransferase
MGILPRVIEGKHVFLAPEQRDNVPLYWKWANDREVTRLTQGYGRAPSLEAMEVSYDKSAVADDVRRFGIHLMSTGDLIGRCELKNLNLIVGRGEASILVGDEKHRGHGYGTEAMRLLCTVGFDMLELHTIFLTVLDCNPHAVALYHRVGFKDAGCLREASARDGKRVDILYMDLLRGDLVLDTESGA